MSELLPLSRREFPSKARKFFLCLPFSCMTLLASAGCQTTTKSFSDHQEGYFQAKATIEDLEEDRSYSLHLEFNAIQNKVLRMDAISPLGQHVASVLLKGNELRILSIDQKTLFVGSAKNRAMPFLPFSFRPHWFYNVLFETSFSSPQWNCKNGKVESKDSLPEKCENSRQNLTISWDRPSESRRVIEISHPKGRAKVSVYRFKPSVEDRENLFTLRKPKSFRRRVFN